MNHWIVIFEDSPEMLAVREKHFADYVSYLTGHLEIFVDGTSLSPAEREKPTGGLWIVRAKDRQAIVRLIEGDPMYQSGFRQFEIFATGKDLSVK